MNQKVGRFSSPTYVRASLDPVSIHPRQGKDANDNDFEHSSAMFIDFEPGTNKIVKGVQFFDSSQSLLFRSIADNILTSITRDSLSYDSRASETFRNQDLS